MDQADGIIEFYDFVKYAVPTDFSSADDAVMALKEKLMTKVSHMQQMFREMDSDHSGTVTKEEIHAAFSNYGIQVDSDLIDRILLKIDFDGDGSIALDELATFFSPSLSQTSFRALVAT